VQVVWVQRGAVGAGGAEQVAFRVPQQERRGQAVPSDLGCLREHPHRPAVPAADAGGAELRSFLGQLLSFCHSAPVPPSVLASPVTFGWPVIPLTIRGEAVGA